MIPAALKNKLVLAAAGGAIAISAVMTGWFEGREHVPYRDPVGVWTVCEGHTGPDVIPGRKYSDAECNRLLAADLAEADQAVTRLVKVPLSDYERAALIDFAFNLGAGALANSTLLRKLNAGDRAGACAEYKRWVNARVNGRLRPLPGLVKRREAATWLCLYEQ